MNTQRYRICVSDGEHETYGDVFDNIEDARTSYQQEIEDYKSEKHQPYISGVEFIEIELCEVDEEGIYEDTITSWNKNEDN